MANIERLREAAYRSPSGATFSGVMQIDDVERQGGKKVAIHEFPQQDAANVQDLGNQVEKYPMAFYFSGADADQRADAFWSALSERGPGGLQHPRWGDIAVLPLTWGQVEQLVDGLNRVEFKVEFVRVPDVVPFPVTTTAIEAAVGTAVDEATAASAAAAATEFAPETAADVAAVKGQVLADVTRQQDVFADVLAASEEIQAKAAAAARNITTKIDDLIGTPKELFDSLAGLAKLPAQVATSVVRKLDGYRAQVEGTAASVPASYAQAVSACQSLFASLGGAAVASTIGTLRSRSEAIAAADALESVLWTATQGVEAAEAAVAGFRADPEALAALVASATEARASMLERAFSLPTERRVTLATERTPLDLIAEFYGDSLADIDAALDDFIATNDLAGDERILVPAGREVVYYA